MSDLTYTIEVEETDYSTRIKAVPSQFAAKPRGEIRWPSPLHSEVSIEVNWSCGGMNFDTQSARQFFNAGLAICNALEARLMEGQTSKSLPKHTHNGATVSE